MRIFALLQLKECEQENPESLGSINLVPAPNSGNILCGALGCSENAFRAQTSPGIEIQKMSFLAICHGKGSP